MKLGQLQVSFDFCLTASLASLLHKMCERERKNKRNLLKSVKAEMRLFSMRHYNLFL